MKRFILLALVFVMIFALAAPAMAFEQKNGYTEADNTYGAVAGAVVEKLNGSQNGLTITVNVDGEIVAEEYFLIANNSAGEFNVGDYKVYVSTSGNTKIDSCFITSVPQQPIPEPKPEPEPEPEPESPEPESPDVNAVIPGEFVI